MTNRTTGSGTLVARYAVAQVREALDDNRIVAIIGSRQSSGKPALARRIAGDDGRRGASPQVISGPPPARSRSSYTFRTCWITTPSPGALDSLPSAVSKAAS